MEPYEVVAAAMSVGDECVRHLESRLPGELIRVHGPALAASIAETLCALGAQGKLSFGRPPELQQHVMVTSLAPVAIPVVGGPFDGSEREPNALQLIVQTPSGSLTHYELCFRFKGYVKQDEAERIIGKKLRE